MPATVTMNAILPPANAVEEEPIMYPDSDGAPMGETGIHAHATLSLYYSLYLLFHSNLDVYVAADMFLYYEKGNPKANRAPDVMVIKGGGNYHRRSFKIWEEGLTPCMIVEVTSKSTMHDDMMFKAALYASLGVREYFLFDPFCEYLEEALIGGRLDGKEYLPIIPNEDGALYSQECGVLFSVDGHVIRLSDPETGRLLPHLNDSVEQMEQAIDQIKREAERADQAAERAEREKQRADQEKQRAEEEKQRAEKEKSRADAAEAEIAHLRALLEDQ